jgi:hypothetical protein
MDHKKEFLSMTDLSKKLLSKNKHRIYDANEAKNGGRKVFLFQYFVRITIYLLLILCYLFSFSSNFSANQFSIIGAFNHSFAMIFLLFFLRVILSICWQFYWLALISLVSFKTSSIDSYLIPVFWLKQVINHKSLLDNTQKRNQNNKEKNVICLVNSKISINQ